ncbi:GNAT family N-acetyltransferase [Aquimarina sp. 2201CG14-23]|uniref:GNAT family N-acetyltransferase n=1 Tax=Aquimarina mycalae TaxID=3040073 RepID=UPI002477D20B|nr:GNAT family N-acetyltransferase [Aquimarina sp. 2201CG14-23]MDH7445867.1 GNAT family N-acetyltransferase [Aquimarina sp. 2201CG14-23]
MIRPYTLSDRKQLVDIFILNTPKYFDQKEIQDFEAYLELHGDTYLTIEYDGEIVGGMGCYVDENDTSGRITWIFFHPNYTGLGLGKKAVAYCLKTFTSNPLVEKSVVTTSQLAYKFFEKFGYNLIRTEKDYWGQGLDLYVMELQLNSN